METLIAVHEIHGIEDNGKKTPIAPGKPFTPNSAKQRDMLLKKGAAKLAPKAEKVEDDADSSKNDDPKPVSKMTLDELVAYAEENKIDLGDAKLKKEVLPIIEEAEKKASGDEGGNDDDLV